MNTIVEKKDVYQLITDIILNKLNEGIIPWKKPWSYYGTAQNYLTKKHYRGINAIILNMFDFNAPFFLTFKQAQDLGGYVKKGSKSIPIIYWNFLYIHTKTGKKINAKDLKNYDKSEVKKTAYLKHYNVFNIEQIEGIDFVIPETKEVTQAEKIQMCEDVITNIPNPPKFYNKDHSKAFYAPLSDLVNVPDIKYFDNPEYYYSVCFHEFVHSTGHEKRLNRKEIVESNKFGSEEYAKEELTAELGAAFICGKMGIEMKTVENSTAYIQHWLKKLQDDKKLLIDAAAKAQKAADYILGQAHEEGEE